LEEDAGGYEEEFMTVWQYMGSLVKIGSRLVGDMIEIGV